MKISRHGWCVMVFLWSVTVVMVTQGRSNPEMSYQRPDERPNRQHQQRAYEQMDEFDRYNNEIPDRVDKTENTDNNNNNNNDFYRPNRPPMLPYYPQSPSSLDRLSKVGEDLMTRMQETFSSAHWKSMISSAYGKEDSGDYGGVGGAGGGCCGLDFNTFVPGFVLVAVSYLLFFLLNATVTSGRRKRMISSDSQADQMLLDGPTWLSMVHELWEQDGALANTACTQETLCRMNRLAMAAPGQAGWAVSMSSLPLSYLLHSRHSEGFTSYMDAALMGRSGANCTELYSACPRLSYYK